MKGPHFESDGASPVSTLPGRPARTTTQLVPIRTVSEIQAAVQHDVAHAGSGAPARETSVKLSKDLFCGGVAGSLAKTVIAPLDRTKIIFQTSAHRAFSWRAVGHELRRIVDTEGVKGLWKGHSATLSRVIPYAGIQFATFQGVKRTVKDAQGGKDLAVWENLLAGAFAGAVSVACTYPLDLMRARMAVDHRTGSLWSNLMRGYGEGGVRSLFRGLPPTLIGILPYSGISFACFDFIKTRRQRATGRKSTPAENAATGAVSGFTVRFFFCWFAALCPRADCGKGSTGNVSAGHCAQAHANRRLH